MREAASANIGVEHPVNSEETCASISFDVALSSWPVRLSRLATTFELNISIAQQKFMRFARSGEATGTRPTNRQCADAAWGAEGRDEPVADGSFRESNWMPSASSVNRIASVDRQRDTRNEVGSARRKENGRSNDFVSSSPTLCGCAGDDFVVHR